MKSDAWDEEDVSLLHWKSKRKMEPSIRIKSFIKLNASHFTAWAKQLGLGFFHFPSKKNRF